jgi:hypothetical protein
MADQEGSEVGFACDLSLKAIPEALRQILREVKSVTAKLGFLPDGIRDIAEKIERFSKHIGLEDDEAQDEEAELKTVTEKLQSFSKSEIDGFISQFDAMFNTMGNISIQLFNEVFAPLDSEISVTKLQDLPDEVRRKLH